MNLLEDTLMLNLIYQIMQQRFIKKNATGIDTSKLVLKSNLANLKAEVDIFDIEKLVTIPVD